MTTTMMIRRANKSDWKKNSRERRKGNKSAKVYIKI